MEPYKVYGETELEAALGALRAREVRRLVDRAVRSSASGVVITDALAPDDPIVYVNPAFESMTGYVAQEIMGSNCRFLQGDDRDQLALNELRSAVAAGHDCRIVLRNYKKNGALFYNELSVSPVRDEEGRVVNFVGVQADVTGRKRVEEELRSSEDRLRLAVEATGLGTWDYDLVTGELRWDERCKAVFGLPPEAGVDYGVFLAGLHPEDREMIDEAVQRTLDPGSGGEFDIEYRTVGLTDGVERWVAARGRAHFDGSGRAVRFVGTVLDVTRRKKTEEERDLLLERERRAREESVAARRRLSLLTRAGVMLSSSLDYEATLERIPRLAVPDLADWCVVDVLEEDGSVRQRAAAHADPEKESLLQELGEHRALAPGALQEGAWRTSAVALRTGKAILVPEVTDERMAQSVSDKAHLSLLRGLEPRSSIFAPLVARGRTLGAVSFVSSRPDRRYGPDDLSLAESLAHRCALALDNARLYGERTRVARALQESLLPTHLPEVPGVEVGLRYLPAGEADVGGDFYDLFDARVHPVPPGAGVSSSCWGVLIGDVSGKGAEAAALLALARYTIRASAMRQTRPTAVLADLNRAVLRHGRAREEGKFCTAAYARLDLDDESAEDRGVRLSVSLAGHPAPVLLRADGEVRRIGHPGRAVGVFDDPRLTEQDVLLAPGDALVLFTDGVTEARAPDGALFGEERLVALLRSSSGLGAEALATRIENAILDFQEGTPGDDLAVLVLRRAR